MNCAKASAASLAVSIFMREAVGEVRAHRLDALACPAPRATSSSAACTRSSISSKLTRSGVSSALTTNRPGSRLKLPRPAVEVEQFLLARPPAPGRAATDASNSRPCTTSSAAVSADARARSSALPVPLEGGTAVADQHLRRGDAIPVEVASFAARSARARRGMVGLSRLPCQAPYLACTSFSDLAVRHVTRHDHGGVVGRVEAAQRRPASSRICRAWPARRPGSRWWCARRCAALNASSLSVSHIFRNGLAALLLYSPSTAPVSVRKVCSS